MRSRRALLGLMAAAMTTAAVPSPAPRPASRNAVGQALAVPDRSLLLAADQASSRVLVLDANDSSWLEHDRPALQAAARAALWSWSPTDDHDLGDLSPHRTWGLVSEAKYRVLDGEEWLLTCASAGMAALVSYSTGRARWATAITGSNPHSVELLPDGNVAVAASDGAFIRVYAASQSDRSTRHAQFDLPGAHGVHWDDARQTLWALGQDQLVALKVGGTPGRPSLTATRIVGLPDSGGHDLDVVARDQSRLWVTTDSRVHEYSIPDAAFVSYDGQQGIDEAGVKSVGDDPLTGQVLTVTPMSGNPCVWCTSAIAFHAPDGRRDVAGSSLYKARWMPRPPTQ